MALRDDVPVARVEVGRGAGMAVSVYGFTTAEVGMPLVEVGGGRDHLHHLTPAKADELAQALMLAARVARGEQVVPMAIDEFLARGRR